MHSLKIHIRLYTPCKLEVKARMVNTDTVAIASVGKISHMPCTIIVTAFLKYAIITILHMHACVFPIACVHHVTLVVVPC